MAQLSSDPPLDWYKSRVKPEQNTPQPWLIKQILHLLQERLIMKEVLEMNRKWVSVKPLCFTTEHNLWLKPDYKWPKHKNQIQEKPCSENNFKQIKQMILFKWLYFSLFLLLLTGTIDFHLLITKPTTRLFCFVTILNFQNLKFTLNERKNSTSNSISFWLPHPDVHAKSKALNSHRFNTLGVQFFNPWRLEIV